MIVDLETDLQHFETIYGQHVAGVTPCPVSVDNLTRARRRVSQVAAAFGLTSRLQGGRVLDIGCGLGYIAEALRLEGASVVAIDMSPMAVARAGALFPKVEWRCQTFPETPIHDKFDVIWVLDISTLNTFDVDEMKRNVIAPGLDLLKPDGVLVVGWHSNFSGRVTGNWSHWPIQTIWQIHRQLGFSGPRVVQTRFGWLSWPVIGICKALQKSCPIYFIRKKKK